MLKIKDNIDLKELEKFGFKYIENNFPKIKMDFSYYEKSIGGNVGLNVSVHNRLIYSDCTGTDSNYTYICSDGLDVLFELIQAGLVEKCQGK